MKSLALKDMGSSKLPRKQNFSFLENSFYDFDKILTIYREPMTVPRGLRHEMSSLS
jgi:hypothetical protein